jgi:hypothetical protein
MLTFLHSFLQTELFCSGGRVLELRLVERCVETAEELVEFN